MESSGELERDSVFCHGLDGPTDQASATRNWKAAAHLGRLHFYGSAVFVDNSRFMRLELFPSGA